MEKPNLAEVTLICVDCLDAARAVRVLEHCRKLCDFGAVVLVTSEPTDYPHETISPIRSLNDYSAFMLKRVHEYVPTSHMLTVQHDGWVLHPEAWDPAWLGHDYVAPLFLQDYPESVAVGSGGFSLRSRRLMATVSARLPDWDGKASWTGPDGKNHWAHEDGVIALAMRQALMADGLTFAPATEGAKFAFGGNLRHYCDRPFGFHGFYAIDRLRGGPGDGYAPWLTPDESSWPPVREKGGVP